LETLIQYTSGTFTWNNILGVLSSKLQLLSDGSLPGNMHDIYSMREVCFFQAIPQQDGTIANVEIVDIIKQNSHLTHEQILDLISERQVYFVDNDHRRNHKLKEFPSGSGLNLFVKNESTHRLMSFELRYSNSIADVKELIQRKNGIPVDRIRLIFDGKDIGDKDLLSDHILSHTVEIL